MKASADIIAIYILQNARTLVAEQKNWNTGCFAKTEAGIQVSPMAKQAVSFCSVGALQRAGGWRLAYNTAREYLSIACCIMCGDANVAHFNDTSTHQEIMELYDVAIAWAIAIAGETYAEHFGEP